jgi:hypothetical protein
MPGGIEGCIKNFRREAGVVNVGVIMLSMGRSTDTVILSLIQVMALALRVGIERGR